MYCKKCGHELEAGSKFCHACGTRQSNLSADRKTSSSVETKNSCPHCGALMKFNAAEGELKCPYCGFGTHRVESETLKLEKMRLEARMKEAEALRLTRQREIDVSEANRERNQALLDKNRRYNLYHRSKMRGWCIFFTVMATLFLFGTAKSGRPLPITLSLVQLVCFVFYFMLGTQFIPEKKDNVHRIFGIIGMALAIPVVLVLA